MATNYGGGDNVPNIVQTEKYVKHLSSCTPVNGELMDALSTDFKGINQVVRFRWACLMLALKLQDDDTSKSRLRDSDIRKNW